MALKIDLNYSPNFTPIKRNSKHIKFLIFHYTGMKKESEALKKLTKIQSEVSSHYFIKNNGDIVLLVPDLYIAWHAGKSSWKSYEYLNKYQKLHEFLKTFEYLSEIYYPTDEIITFNICGKEYLYSQRMSLVLSYLKGDEVISPILYHYNQQMLKCQEVI